MPDARMDELTLSWLVVSHESAADLAVLLPALRDELGSLSSNGLRCEIVVADNASSDGSAAVARRLLPDSDVLKLPRNHGYGAALNRAAAVARGQWLACSNADLSLAAGDLANLPAVLSAAPRDAGLLGPEVRDDHGDWQASAGSFPTLRRLLTRLPRRAAERPYMPRSRHRAGRVDWVTGACVFVRAEAFRAIGGFDESFFLYYEDVDLALRGLQRGWTTRYVPDVRVRHLHPHAGRRRDPRIEAHVRASRALWFERHRPVLEGRLLGLLARVEPMLRGREPGHPSRDAPRETGASRGSGGARAAQGADDA